MGFFRKIKGIFSAPKSGQDFEVSEEVLEDLELAMLENNFGEKLSGDFVKKVNKRAKKISGLESIGAVLTQALAEQIEEVCSPHLKEMPEPKKEGPLILVLVGANGSGKTTLTAKLSRYYKEKGCRVLLVLGDTFRAAALEQSEEWAKSIGIDVHQGRGYGADPASVAFDAARRAKNEDYDVVLVDTAGRLHTSVDLMAQLEKIYRVLQKQDASYPHEIILALDSTTGSYMVSMVNGYKKYIPVSGVVLTKGDGYSGGGAFLQVLDACPVSVFGVSFGETKDTFGPFKTAKFAQRILKDFEK